MAGTGYVSRSPKVRKRIGAKPTRARKYTYEFLGRREDGAPLYRAHLIDREAGRYAVIDGNRRRVK